VDVQPTVWIMVAGDLALTNACIAMVTFITEVAFHLVTRPVSYYSTKLLVFLKYAPPVTQSALTDAPERWENMFNFWLYQKYG